MGFLENLISTCLRWLNTGLNVSTHEMLGSIHTRDRSMAITVPAVVLISSGTSVSWYRTDYIKKNFILIGKNALTHWGRVTHICVGKLTIIGSDNGLSPERRQAIIWTNAEILLIGPPGTNLSEILIEIQTFSLKEIRLKMSSAKCCSFRLGLNVL